jgi:hypothetical protein
LLPTLELCWHQLSSSFLKRSKKANVEAHVTHQNGRKKRSFKKTAAATAPEAITKMKPFQRERGKNKNNLPPRFKYTVIPNQRKNDRISP